MDDKLNILIAAGGSAGHLYPALALAESLKKENNVSDIAFVSSTRGALDKVIREYGYKTFLVSIVNFKWTPVKLLQALYRFIKSFLEVFLIIEGFRPDVVVGFGSYVSFPVVLEAALFKKPTIIHEQNVSLGLSNRVLSALADVVAVSFKDGLRQKKYIFTGNPLIKREASQDKKNIREFFGLGDKFTILVMGGSQGAKRINNAFKESLGLLGDFSKDFQVIHITGKSDYAQLKQWYANQGVKHCVFDFLEEMNKAYGLADMAISRAGATSIAELAYFGIPSILIPYPGARSHQLENALALSSRKAALVIEEKDLNAKSLFENTARLISSSLIREELKENIQAFAKKDAAGELARVVLGLAA